MAHARVCKLLNCLETWQSSHGGSDLLNRLYDLGVTYLIGCMTKIWMKATKRGTHRLPGYLHYGYVLLTRV